MQFFFINVILGKYMHILLAEKKEYSYSTKMFYKISFDFPLLSIYAGLAENFFIKMKV